MHRKMVCESRVAETWETATDKMEWTEIALLFFTGFLAFSALSSVIQKSLKLPLYLPEIFLLPWLFYYKKTISNILKNTKFTTGLVLFIWVFVSLLLYGFTVNVFNTILLINAVTAVRPLVYMCIMVICLMRNRCTVNVEKLFIVALGTVVADQLHMLFGFESLSSISHINTVAVMLIVAIPFARQKFGFGVVTSLFGLIVAAQSVYRRILFAVLITIFISVVFYALKKKSAKKIVALVFISSAVALIVKNLYAILDFIIRLLGLSGNVAYRLIEKTQELVQGTYSAADTHRLTLYAEMIQMTLPSLLPQGAIRKEWGIYSDVPINYLYDSVGSAFSFVLIAVVFGKGFTSFISCLFSNKDDIFLVVSGLCFPALVFLFATDGTFMTYTNIAFLSGLLFAGWFKKVDRI